jgi:hypothetical protein
MIVISIIASSIAVSIVLLYLYHTRGGRDLLLSGIAILATLPVDIAVLYFYLTSTKKNIPILLKELIAKFDPVSIGAVRTWGETVLSIKLPDNSLLYIAVSPSKIKGIYIANPSITSLDPGLDNVKPPWRLAGATNALVCE